MKTKEEILKMSQEALSEYMLSQDLDARSSTDCAGCIGCIDCIGCTGCTGCIDCTGCIYSIYCIYCIYCTDCYKCRNANGLKYAICNVMVGKDAYEKKMKELGVV